MFACIINMSQFFIIAQTGPVSSTVVGHVKTCSIVTLGWVTSGRAVGDKSVIGVFIAIGGIITYSIVMLSTKRSKVNRDPSPTKELKPWPRLRLEFLIDVAASRFSSIARAPVENTRPFPISSANISRRLCYELPIRNSHLYKFRNRSVLAFMVFSGIGEFRGIWSFDAWIDRNAPYLHLKKFVLGFCLFFFAWEYSLAECEIL